MRKSVQVMTVAALLVSTQGAHAACTASTVKGDWGFSYDAVDLVGGRSCVGVGLLSFNTGNLSNNSVKISAQRNSCAGSAVTNFAAAGSYTVSSTCIGRSTNLKYTASSKASTFDFNIVEAGTRLQFILVQGNGLTLRGEAFKR